MKTSCLDILSFFLVTPRNCNSDGVFDGARQFENVFDGVHFLHISRAFYFVIFAFRFDGLRQFCFGFDGVRQFRFPAIVCPNFPPEVVWRVLVSFFADLARDAWQLNRRGNGALRRCVDGVVNLAPAISGNMFGGARRGGWKPKKKPNPPCH